MTDTPNTDADRPERGSFEARAELLSAYMDGELGPEQARAVSEWLDSHPGALRDLEHDRRVWDLLGTYEDEQPSEGFTQDVLSACGVATPEAADRESRAAPVLKLAWYQQPLAVAAAFLLAIGGVSFALARGGGEAQTRETMMPRTEVFQAEAVTESLDHLPDEVLADGLEFIADAEPDDLDLMLGELLGG